MQRKLKTTKLILCQGHVTEVNYFRGFHSATVRSLRHPSAKHIVSKALRYKEEFVRMQGIEIDETWIVMDRNTFPKTHLVEEFKKAESQSIDIAISNVCFELWILQHFGAYQKTATSSSVYLKELDEIFKKRGIDKSGYRKNDRNIFFKLKTFMSRAIINSEKLLKKQGDDFLLTPWTNVHKLVELLLKDST